MQPLWNKNDGVVYAEAGMFFGTRPVRLLYPAEKILSVKCPVKGLEFKEGIDFTHTPGSDLIYRVENGAIPALAEDAIYPDKATAKCHPGENANAVGGGPDGNFLLFSAKDFFAQNQVEIDYQTAERNFPELPQLESGQLPRFCSRLKPGNKLSVTLIGDSISEGYNATKYLNVPPFNPTYIEHFADELSARTGAEISVRNAAVNGTGTEHAFTIRERWLDEPCDLLVIAYGMNDYARLTPEKFQENVCRIMAEKKAVHPETEFLLLTSMTGNPQWCHTPEGCETPFAEKVKALSAETVAIADVRALWRKLLERKDFYDLSGNGVNHPNDYGHRVYATVLTALFDSKINQ